MRLTSTFLLALVATAGCRSADVPPLPGSGGELNVYSARHYASDQLIYDGFSRATGIKVNLIEARAELLMERLKGEGAASPADVILAVDAGNLWRAAADGLFQPVRSGVLEAGIPRAERDPEGLWFGFSKRARVIAYDKATVDPATLTDYFDLASPRFKGNVCARSSGNVYNLSLMAMMIAHHGPERAQAWARGVVANFSRPPTGGDTDQLKAVAEGVCALAITNHYYWLRLARSADSTERAVAERTGLFFPDQAGFGTHVNIAGAGVAAHAPNRANAIRFLEYLLTPEVQAIFARENDEFPVSADARYDHPGLAALGTFREDTLPTVVFGQQQALAQKLLDGAGWR